MRKALIGLSALFTTAGMATAASAADNIFITINNDTGGTITSSTLACNSATCSATGAIASGLSEDYTAETVTTGSFTLIIVKYGTFGKECKASLSLRRSGGTIIEIRFDTVEKFTGINSICEGDNQAQLDPIDGKVTWDIKIQ